MTTMEFAVSRSEAAVFLKAIDALIVQEPEIRGAMVATIDGFAIAANLPERMDAARLAAMTSSLLALAEAMCLDGEVGDCRDITVDAHGGRILLMDIAHPWKRLVLGVLCGSKVTLGQVLWAVRSCRDSLSSQTGKR